MFVSLCGWDWERSAWEKCLSLIICPWRARSCKNESKTKMSLTLSLWVSLGSARVSLTLVVFPTGYHGKMSPVSQQSEDEQPCDLRLLTPATCLRELAAASAQPATAATVPNPFAMCPPVVATASTAGTSVDHKAPLLPPQPTLTPSLSALRGVRLMGATLTTPGGAYTCNRCGNSYARPHSLNRHIRFECGVEPKFECPVCHKKSKHKHNLVLHMRTHQNRWWSSRWLKVHLNLAIALR